MFRRLKGFVGNAPIRLVATILVAIMIPSLLVTGLGLFAVHQANQYVREQADDEFWIKLPILRSKVRAEWGGWMARNVALLRDADQRVEYLGGLRDDPHVLDVLIWDGGPPRLLPMGLPYRELRLRGEHRGLQDARELEVAGENAHALRAYEELFAVPTDEALTLEAMLGAARSSCELNRTRRAVELLDGVLQRFGETVDETGVVRKFPILLRKLEILDADANPERENAARAFVVALEHERDRLDPEMARFYRDRLEKLAPKEFATMSEDSVAGPSESVTGRVIDSAALTALEADLVAAAEDARSAPEVVVVVEVDVPGRGMATFAQFASEGGEVVVCMLLDRDRFFEDVDLFLNDLGIPKDGLRVGAIQLEKSEPSTPVPRPFDTLEWRYVAETGSLPAGLETFKVVTVATFTWAVIVLVLTILVGTFLTLRVVLLEMKTARMKTDFVSFIGHELKTPLSAIRMFSETLLTGRVDNEDEEKLCLQLIDREGERLTNLIDRILEYSKIQSNQKVFEFTSCSMVDVVEEAVILFNEHHKSHPRKIGVNAVQHISKIRMDRAAMVEVILNLLSNAGKYSPDDEEIMINLRESIDEIAVEVVDRGVGIRKRDQRRIFDKFYRADDFLTRDVDGYGLGLAFARYIARQHKGDIRVSSQVNSGSTFTLHLRKTDVLAE